jgi:hypothetical protein
LIYLIEFRFYLYCENHYSLLVEHRIIWIYLIESKFKFVLVARNIHSTKNKKLCWFIW